MNRPQNVHPVLNKSRRALGKREISVGRLRLDRVLYDESSPMDELLASFARHVIKEEPEILLIMGSSLQVYGVKSSSKNSRRLSMLTLRQTAWRESY